MTTPKPNLWQRLSLRGRLLAIMLTSTLTASLLCTAVFGVAFARTMSMAKKSQQSLTENVHFMLETLINQQDTHIKGIYAQQQAVFLDEQLARFAEQGESPNWVELLTDAYDLTNGAEVYGDGRGVLETAGATLFLQIDSKMYVHGNSALTREGFATAVNDFCSEAQLENDFSTLLADFPGFDTFTAGDSGMILVWRPFAEERGRVGMLVPVAASDASGALSELMERESALAAAESAKATLWAAIVLISFVILLIALLVFTSRKLSNVYVTPVEDEMHRNADENAMLAQLSRMKTEFLTNASHEMRTPLTVTSVNVQTVMEILEDMGEAVEGDEAERLLQSAQSEIMRLSRMVAGMLTLASISEDTEKRRVDISSLVQNGVSAMTLHLEKRGNIVRSTVEDGLTVFGNADLLTQVLANLLQNAGAHTENGTVTVTAGRQGSEITVEVRDTGCGIAPELLPYVFNRGVSTEGTGFGLYLCKTVIESHGGDIWVESTLGQGTAVFYTLPFYEGQLGGDEE